MSDGLTDKECMKILTSWCMDLFLLNEFTESQQKEIAKFNELFPDKTHRLIKNRTERKERMLNHFRNITSDAVMNGEGSASGYCVANHNGGESYELKITVKRDRLTPELKEKHFGKVINTCLYCMHAECNEKGVYCNLHNKKVDNNYSCSDWNI